LLLGTLFNFFQLEIADGLIFKYLATFPVPQSNVIKCETSFISFFQKFTF
jgi:hypothetical protein